ncbi:hypothetical protein Back11_54220 [Paenibacillus baekrokdamisoli]|uniref:Uncharacterized protein n=1 Tax=Paenibacillus baekrokdamisoli TaxID=1712516 RepID=A0A3G9IYS3_9BACL|nr:hypothetical protein [Paenibacillus baekrokdamisoli]MBB3071940.1 phosphoglycerate dehydrogenase-like enzyme [Paenibacillus baekrokdamisoli]BBH24077.1 hypothetical protein Back11_54220 [Paenibacillus baekrokdamisoli]
MRKAGYQVDVYDGIATADLPNTIEDAEILVVQLQQVTEALLDQMPSLKLIAREGIGLDSISLQAASKRGITVMNVPDYCLEEVALLHHPKAIVTNHIAWYSEQSEARLRNLTSNRIIDFLEGREIPNIVNKKALESMTIK